MRTILIILFLSCISLSQVKSQVVSGTPLSEIDVEFIKIQIYPMLRRDKIKIMLDFGQESLNDKDKIILDSSGKEKTFNSMVEVVNFMYGYGYQINDNQLNLNSSILLRKKRD